MLQPCVMMDSNGHALQPTYTRPCRNCVDGPIAIFWDIENCEVPNGVSPDEIAGNVRMALRRHPVIKGVVTTFSAYGDFHIFPARLREGCQRTDVKLIYVPNSRKDASDKAILIDMFLFAFDNPPPSTIMLISGDVDFAPALHVLGQRGYTVFLVIPGGFVSSALCNAGDFVWDWASLARGEGLKTVVPPHGSVARQVNENPDGSSQEEARGLSQSYPIVGDVLEKGKNDMEELHFSTPRAKKLDRAEQQRLSQPLDPGRFNEVSASPASANYKVSSGGRTNQLFSQGSTKSPPGKQATVAEVFNEILKDSPHLIKEQLATYCKKRKLALPVYSCEPEGPPDALCFKCKVVVGEQSYICEELFSTSNQAERAAAKVALSSLLPGIEEDELPYKSLLQTLTQKGSHPKPTYSTTKSVEAREDFFASIVKVGGESFNGEKEKTKKQAELSATKIAYLSLKQDTPQVFKRRLQVYCERRNLAAPFYSCERLGPPEAFCFKCKFVVDEQSYMCEELFSTLNNAEQAAAKVALSLLPGVEEDYKILLHELTQKRGHTLLTYRTTKSGKAHELIVKIGEKSFNGGEAKSKRRAEFSAAKIAYISLNQDSDCSNTIVGDVLQKGKEDRDELYSDTAQAERLETRIARVETLDGDKKQTLPQVEMLDEDKKQTLAPVERLDGDEKQGVERLHGNKKQTLPQVEMLDGDKKQTLAPVERLEGDEKQGIERLDGDIVVPQLLEICCKKEKDTGELYSDTARADRLKKKLDRVEMLDVDKKQTLAQIERLDGDEKQTLAQVETLDGDKKQTLTQVDGDEKQGVKRKRKRRAQVERLDGDKKQTLAQVEMLGGDKEQTLARVERLDGDEKEKQTLAQVEGLDGDEKQGVKRKRKKRVLVEGLDEAKKQKLSQPLDPKRCSGGGIERELMILF